MAVVTALPGSEAHAAMLATRLKLPLMPLVLRRFPDGEIYVRMDRVDDHVVIVGSLYPSPAERFMELAFVAATARDLGAKRVGLVAPYLAFMRQDVQFHPGEGITSKYFARMVSSTVDWMVTVDPHLHRYSSLDGIYKIPTAIAHAAPAIADWVRREVEHPVLVGPDAESVQWVSAVASACEAPFVILEKTRRGDRDVSISQPSREWNKHTPVLIDDIISTGKTMIEATRQLRAVGAKPPVCVAIHAVFADALHEELVAAGATGVITCNTIPHASNRICVADPIAEAARQYL